MRPKAQAGKYPPPPVPNAPTATSLREAAQHCRSCDLFADATQAVIGEGPTTARVMLVGEQPGDREDTEGRPFVGPAGRVLDEGLNRAGIDRDDAYVTNVVKHFRFKQRGKRRMHQRPDRWHTNACLPWLQSELAMVQPKAIVLLGAVAAQTLIGPSVRVGAARGQPLESGLAELVTVTAHPSSILRVGARTQRKAAMDAWVADLTIVAEWLAARSYLTAPEAVHGSRASTRVVRSSRATTHLRPEAHGS